MPPGLKVNVSSPWLKPLPANTHRRLASAQPSAGPLHTTPPTLPANSSRPLVSPAPRDAEVVPSAYPSALTTRAPRLRPTVGGPRLLPAQPPSPIRVIGAETRPRDAAGRWKLARDLQRELRRVGCYDGRIDGSWGPGSRRAMAGFVAKMNASLPVEEPDYILLSLLRGQRAQVCGLACPDGSFARTGGHCRPSLQAGKGAPPGRIARAVPRPRMLAPPMALGVATPMAGAPTQSFALPATTDPRRPRLRIQQPQSIPIARPFRRDLEVIATRIPSRLGHARGPLPAGDDQRGRTAIVPPPSGVLPAAPFPPDTQVAAQPPPQVYRSQRAKWLRSRRPRATFWRNLERNGD
jgi:hypothetical protein